MHCILILIESSRLPKIESEETQNGSKNGSIAFFSKSDHWTFQVFLHGVRRP